MTKITGCSKSDEARRNLLNYALQGKWDEAMKVYQQHPWLHPVKITPGGDTALHIAVWDCKESWVVAKMVKLVRDHPQQYEGVLKSKDEQGNTPLHLAATIGNVSMCKCITREPNDLVSIGNKDGENPIFLAARHGKIEAFLCLLCKASESDPDSYIYRRNKKGETILHCAIAGGHFKLAFLIIQRYKDLCNTLDEKGASPLHVLAKQSTAFRSKTPLSLIEKIIYHCIFVLPPCFGDAEKCNDPAERQTLVKLLPVLWNNIKRLFFLLVAFIKICINPSTGERAENASIDLDEEMPAQAILQQGPASTPDQGAHEHSKEDEKKVGLSQRPDDLRNFPVNYDTCFNFIRLLIQAILLVLGIGRSYINEIQKKKEKHVWSAKILEKLLDESKDHWYASTGKKPKDRFTILDEQEKLGEDRGPECEKSSEEKVQSPMHKLLEQAQMSIDLMRKLLEQAQTNRLPTDDRSLTKNPRQQLENKTDKQNGKDPNIYMSPLLVAARHGTTEMVEKILQIQPAAILEVDPANKNIFLLAAEHKRFEVLELLREKFSNMKSAFRAVDNMGNNALHAAAKYRPGRWIGIPEGLQMQVETILFETVKKSVPEYILGGSNNENMTPKEVFEHTHAKLVETCRKWLKDISNQCSGLAGIIASVTFATSTAIPGGVTEKDRPKLENQLGFTIFAVSSLIALSSSVTSAVVFLTIANSRHETGHFARKVPRMLFFGFFTLFISIAATLISFCGAHIYILGYKLKYAAIPLYALVVLPITVFSLAQFRKSYLQLALATFEMNVDDSG